MIVLVLARIVYMAIKGFYRIHFIEKFKYEQSVRDRMDIGTDRAVRLWFSNGYESRFNKGFGSHLIRLMSIGGNKAKTEAVYTLYKDIINPKGDHSKGINE
jgi:hypothetical protein